MVNFKLSFDRIITDAMTNCGMRYSNSSESVTISPCNIMPTSNFIRP